MLLLARTRVITLERVRSGYEDLLLEVPYIKDACKMADSKRSHSDSRKRYKHRIPLREDIIKIMKAVDKPMALAVVSARFNLKNKQQQKALQTRLRAMVRDG